jgi:BolA family transcriptional regulator, general stress-responsive regulator
MSAARVAMIRERLQQALSPLELDIVDESHKHAGHAGARDGRGHFRVRIVAMAFAGLPAIRRHQLVYAALAELMQTDIHALAMETRAPDEAPTARPDQ